MREARFQSASLYAPGAHRMGLGLARIGLDDLARDNAEGGMCHHVRKARIGTRERETCGGRPPRGRGVWLRSPARPFCRAPGAERIEPRDPPLEHEGIGRPVRRVERMKV